MFKKNKFLVAIFLVSILFLMGSFYYQYIFLNKLKHNDVIGCRPYNFNKEIINNEYYLKWETKDECSGYVRYGSSDVDFPYLGLDEQGVVKIREHKVSLKSLNNGDTYYFVIFSDEKSYGVENSPLKISFN